jgi:hypothetical protein
MIITRSVMRASRSLLARLAFAGTVVALVAAGAFVAHSADATTLPAPTPCGEKACEYTDFKHVLTFPAARARWSVAATRGTVPGGTELSLMQGPRVFATTNSPEGTTWIAVDNTPGHQPTGTYELGLDVWVPASAPTDHWVQFHNGRGDLLQQRSSTVGDAAGTWLADIRDVRLQAGDMLGLTVHGGEIGSISVLASDPARPSSWIQTRGSEVSTFWVPKADTPEQTRDFTFTAPATGTYGLLFEPQGWWSRASTVDAAIVG